MWMGAKGQVPACLLGALQPQGEASREEGGWAGLEKPGLWLRGQGHEGLASQVASLVEAGLRAGRQV